MIYVMLKLSLLHTTQQHTTPTGPHEMHATPHDKGLHVTHTHTPPSVKKTHNRRKISPFRDQSWIRNNKEK